ncbi:unnamed protein product [Mycena citricolor]|uniref:Uncharacterized protein n=1 Tax=Mycena citricolor TaxID=2018698 RepID=A0AAD2HAI3_9AGAR|nr:unnamed protein product [Mycena citricolor]
MLAVGMLAMTPSVRRNLMLPLALRSSCFHCLISDALVTEPSVALTSVGAVSVSTYEIP